MKALKKLSLSITTLGILGSVILAGYNSMVVNNDAFMTADSGIRFTKRLDELNGKVTIGRMAASTQNWSDLSETKREVKTITKRTARKANRVANKVSKTAEKAVRVPSPAIDANLELSLSNVFHKKPLKTGSFSGSAKTIDGIIEEIYVSLPNGKVIDINTRDRMVGNVFQYEDTATREMRSGMFYEVKKGKYMITLTNDSQFPGARLEFTAANGEEIAYNEDHYESTHNWGMDEQNNNSDLAQENLDNNQQVDQGIEDDYAQNYETEENTEYGVNFQS